MINRITLIMAVFLLTLSNCGISQKASSSDAIVTRKTVEGKAKKIYERAMKYTFSNLNDKALEDYEKLIKMEPKFIDAHLQIAAIKYDQEDYVAAEQGFEKVIELDPTYKKKVYYTLAITEWKMDKFQEAAQHFDEYLKTNPSNEVLVAKAKKFKANCNFAANAIANPVPFNPKSLGPNINTSNPEYLPSLTADGEMLVYTARVRGQEDFYISSKVDGVWQKGKPLNDVNTEANEGAQSISADGKFLVFTACNRKDGYGSCDIYFSEAKNGKWTEPGNIGSPINSRSWESQPSISADGKALYFVSNRSGGEGAKDIWVSRRNKEGKWGTPINLGNVINTEEDDQSPFIHADGQTLYFMSKGNIGMGDHDLFLSRRDAKGNWSDPQNLGYPINTKANEGALVISLDGKTAYFATDRNTLKEGEDSAFDSGESTGETDLYSFSLHENARPQPVTYVKADVFDVSDNKSLVAKVDILDLATGNIHTSDYSDSDGTFLVCLPLGKNYALNVSKDQYLFHSENFALASVSSLDKPYILEIGLVPIPKKDANTPAAEIPVTSSKPIILKNVFFETGSAELRNESIAELNRLRDMLQNYADLKIQLNGHTDNVGSESDNLLLSENRAKAVRDYLISQSINAARLSFKGYGEGQPIDSNDTDFGRQNNRRTEFIIVQ